MLDDSKKSIKLTGKDVAYGLVKGALGAVPLAGPIASEVFTLAVTAPVEKKKNEYMSELADKIVILTENVERVQAIVSNELFLASLYQGMSLHMQSADKDKRNYIYNAVINSALLNPIEELRIKHMATLANIGGLHARVLDFFSNPYPHLESINYPISDVTSRLTGISTVSVYKCFPKYEEMLINIAIEDLKRDGLINQERNTITINPAGSHIKNLTPYGEEFLKFIKEPVITSHMQPKPEDLAKL